MNAESILDALNDFERKPTEIPPILEDYLLRIAQNGDIIFPWCKLKPLLKRKLEVVLDEFYESCPVEISVPVPNFEAFNYDTLKKSILQAVDSFTSAPFTIQRLCELVTNPKKHYNRTDKYMRGVEKNVLVVSTIEPRSNMQNDANANVNPIVNGMINDSPRDDNDCFNGHETTESDSSANLNTPANHVLLDNFANVFPSAACIPSPSNICINREIDSINREIDSNFIPTSECVETQEVEFASQVSLEPSETAETKEEQMDTTTEDQQNCPNEETCEVTTAETEQVTESETSNKSDVEEQDHKIEEGIDSQVSETTSSVEENVSASENVKNEADCSESHTDSDVTVAKKETADSNQCQQDDTISQSDDNTPNTNEISQSDEACDTCKASDNEETVPESASEVSQSLSNSDSSDQCMELESSSSEETSL